MRVQNMANTIAGTRYAIFDSDDRRIGTIEVCAKSGQIAGSLERANRGGRLLTVARSRAPTLHDCLAELYLQKA